MTFERKLFGKKSRELSQGQLENVLRVKIDPAGSWQSMLDYLQKPGTVEHEKYVRFLVTENFDLILSLLEHRMLLIKLGINESTCLISNGQVRFNPISQKVRFFYSSREMPKIEHAREAAENKIKEFLKSNGLEISN